MGYVQTLSEIERGMVATREDFPEAIPHNSRRLQTFCDEGKMYGAMYQGSLLNNEYGPGSDVDIVIISYDDYYFEMTRELEKLKYEIFQKKHVPIEPQPHIKFSDAVNATHKMNRLFMSHLKILVGNDNIIGNNPLEIIKQKPLKHAHDEEHDIVQKMLVQSNEIGGKTLRRDPNDYVYCEYLENLIRRPIWAAYDMLKLNRPLGTTDLSGWEPTHEQPLTEDRKIPTKEHIVKMYLETFPDIGAEEHIMAIMKIRRKYRDFLANFREIKNPEKIYPALLSEIETHQSYAKEFFSKNLQHLFAKY